MLKIEEIQIPNYEKVIEAKDPNSGLHCFIAVHNTTLGPAMGGVRIQPYHSREEALQDALHLAQAMTYKSALAENGLGGGKSVIIANPKTDKTPQLLMAFGKVIDYLRGIYIAAEDVGTTTDDMAIIHRETPYVGALPTEKSSGDPSRFTAWGVFQGMRAVAKHLWNDTCLRKKVIAIQGLGNVGSKLAEILFWEGAYLILCDKDPKVAYHYSLLYGAQAVTPPHFMKTSCDILAPCALGGVLNKETIPELRCQAVAGSANNQLLLPHDGLELLRREILYAPDYVINAGGIINAAAEFSSEGYDPKRARDKVNHIYDNLLAIFKKADQAHQPTNQIADALAEQKLRQQVGKRSQPVRFKEKVKARG